MLLDVRTETLFPGAIPSLPDTWTGASTVSERLGWMRPVV
jgi:hypothetical protein